MDDGAVGHLLSREIWYGAQSHHPCQWVIVEVRWWRQCCADGLTGSFGSSGGVTKLRSSPHVDDYLLHDKADINKPSMLDRKRPQPAIPIAFLNTEDITPVGLLFHVALDAASSCPTVKELTTEHV